MERNKNIEALRALAISYMLLYHYMQSVPGIVTTNGESIFAESLGQFALIGFFVLSGFGTYLSFYHMEKDGNNGINGVTWTIGVLFQLYLVAIPLYYCVKKHGILSWGIGAVICIVLIQFMAKYEYGIYFWHMVLMGNIMTFQPDWYVWLVNKKMPLMEGGG